MTQSRKKRGGLSGETLGGILAGFDQQIMRTLPPPHELVQKGAPIRSLTGEDGGTITIGLPDHISLDEPPIVGPPDVAIDIVAEDGTLASRDVAPD